MNPEPTQEQKQEYHPPAIIYESELTTRAGSRIEGGDYEVAPELLFGEVK